MRARRDLARPGEGDDVTGWLARLGRAKGINAAFLNHPEHTVDAGLSVAELRFALQAAGLEAAAVCTRFPASRFRNGAFSAPDAATRAEAVAMAAEGCAWAAELGARELVLFSQYDGYDYSLAINHSQAWAHTVQSLRALTSACPPSVSLSLEWKPSDAAARFAVVPNTAAALLLAREVGPNFGVTLDVGHALLAGENPGASAAMLLDAGRLAGVQLGDAHSRLGAEDGLAFGSVHGVAALELVHVLRVGGYNGTWYFDTFPAREDPVREAEMNVRSVQAMWRRSLALQQAGLAEAMQRQDAMAVLEMLERVA